MRKCAWLLVLVFLVYGCGEGGDSSFNQEPANITFPASERIRQYRGGLVLAVGADSITSDQIVGALIEETGRLVSLFEHLAPIAVVNRNDFEAFRREVREEIEAVVDGRISNILLYRQAREKMSEYMDVRLERAAADEFRRLVEEDFDGDYERAEAELEEMGLSRDGYKEYVKKTQLIDYHIAEKFSKTKPTHTEMLDYYERNKDRFFAKTAVLKMQMLDIDVAGVMIVDPNRDWYEQAFGQAVDLVKLAKVGKDLYELADRYRGVSFVPFESVHTENLQYQPLANQALSMAPGDIAGPIEIPQIPAKGHIFIIKLQEKRVETYMPFQEVQRQVATIITVERRMKAREEIRAEAVRQAAVSGKDEFVDFCLKRIFELSNM